jgi:serpin B
MIWYSPTTRIVLLTIGLMAIVGCQKNQSNPVLDQYIIPGTELVEGNVLKSTAERNTVTAPDEDIAKVAEGNNAFAWSMFNELFKEKTNMVFSPYSISTALAMTWVGARGETNYEMKQALRLPFGGAQFYCAMNAIDRQLQSRGQGAGGREGQGFSLKVNNALWGEQTAKFSLYFLDTLAQFYNAGMGLCDFVNNLEPARQTINSWISNKTNNKIQDMIPQGAINESTCLVLTNTIYFDAVWTDTFMHEGTHQSWFYRSIGDSVKAWFMNRTNSCNYSENEHFQALEMPYGGKQVSMVVLLPKDKQFLPSASTINDTIIKGLIAGFASKNVEIRMPKFTFKFGTVSLKPQLQELGMRLAFGNADFSGICDSLPLAISDVVHQAYIAVDEKGTTAAAATAVIMAGGIHESGVLMSLDRPFIFLIRDIPTDQALFIGYMADPTAAN